MASHQCPAEGPSVRPPDLAPDAVRGDEPDVLAGWDADVAPGDVARWQIDRRPFPTDTMTVVAAGLVGGILGALVDPRRGRGVGIGASAGLVTAGAVRRIWRLET